MKLSRIGRASLALVALVALGLSMTACGGGTIAYMWVIGTQTTSSSASTIVGFKVDNYTGNLTNIPTSPFTSAGSNPVSIAVRPGGRFVYVVNQGSSTDPQKPSYDGNIAAFSVGGDGRLVSQESYTSAGQTPVWAATDAAGTYLYVLDSLDPTNLPNSGVTPSGTGDVTVFSIAADTGRLTPVTNQQTKNASNVNISYFPVGANPTTMRVSPSGCLFILDKNQASEAYNTAIFPYQIQTGGQLTLTVNSQITTTATNVSSVNVGGNYVYLTDVGPSTAGVPNGNGSILPYTVGTNCALNAVTGGTQPNIAPGQTPVYTLTEARGKFLFVVNQSSTNAQSPYSSISAFTVLSDGRLQPVPDSNNPYAIGSGPTCMVEDPTNQYLYTSNSVDGNVTGKVINSTSGQLSDLSRGSKFAAVTHATCLGLSGAVD